jgi:hypothetical protein
MVANIWHTFGTVTSMVKRYESILPRNVCQEECHYTTYNSTVAHVTENAQDLKTRWHTLTARLMCTWVTPPVKGWRPHAHNGEVGLLITDYRSQLVPFNGHEIEIVARVKREAK